MIHPSANHRARLDGIGLERLVVDLLTEAGSPLDGFRIEHRPSLQAPDGRYEIDATVRFRALGVDFLVLVECKDHVRPIERDVVQVLADRKRTTGAQKAILFSTNGFQRGAIEYTKVHGIALVRVVEGALSYETKSADQAKPPVPPPWASTPAYIGQVIYLHEDAIHVWSVELGRPDALVDYLKSA
jgi:restriction system protein